MKFRKLNKKRTIIILSIAGAILLLGGYVLWSVCFWNSYKTSYEKWQQELKKDSDSALALPVETSAERSKKKTAFKDVSGEITSARESLCDVANLFAWQRFITSLREYEEACAQVTDQASVFGKKMQQVIAYLDNDQALAKALSTAVAASNGKVTEATWSVQPSIWQDAEKAMNKIPTSEASFKTVRTAAIDKVKAVQSAWADLIAAHDAKDKAKYKDAQAKLAIAYEALPSLVNMSNQQFKVIAESLQHEYEELFKSKV